LVDVLDRQGLRQNTLVIFTSDHGEMMGAHGMMNKAILLEEAVRVPLIMSAGSLDKNVTIKTPVSQLDLHSSILDYLGAQESDVSDGASLRRFIRNRSSNSEFDETAVVVELDERFPVNGRQLSMPIGAIPNYMIRKGE
jgi:arylsulfatase A-like enzyme